MIKLMRISEIMWLLVGAVCLILGTYESSKTGIERNWYMFVFTFIAGVMYAVRKKQRQNVEEKEKEK
jgi:uncharacterized membrane protein YiaA